MASLTTTVDKIGVNGYKVYTSGSLTSMSTGTSSVTLTCGSAEDVCVFVYNPEPVDDITITISAAASSGGNISAIRGDKIFTTTLDSSGYAFISGLESGWFQSTSNTLTFTFSTTVLFAAFERSSTRTY